MGSGRTRVRLNAGATSIEQWLTRAQDLPPGVVCRTIFSTDFTLAESARLMPVNTSPSSFTRAPPSGLISCKPAAARLEIFVSRFSPSSSLAPAPVSDSAFAPTVGSFICANSVVTTRRQPVVTTRTLPQRIRAYRDLSQVTTPRDGLPGTSLSQTTQHGLPLPALGGSPQQSRQLDAPQSLGSMAHLDGETSHRKRHRRQCRVPRRQPENSARNGSGVPCPS